MIDPDVPSRPIERCPTANLEVDNARRAFFKRLGRIRSEALKQHTGTSTLREPTQQHWKRVQMRTRPDETEEQRGKRVRCEVGGRHARDAVNRAADAAVRRELFPHGSFSAVSGPAPAHVVWPPPPKREWRRGLTPLDKATFVDDYYEVLEALPTRLHKCPNCLQLDCTHGTDDPDTRCTFCQRQPAAHHSSNGLELDMQPDESGARRDGEHLQMARLQWEALTLEWGGLTIVEEALLSPVIACKGVLRLPNGGQMAYTGSFINFTQEVGTIAAQLPRAVGDTGIVVYRARGEEGTSKLLTVRRYAVKAYFEFFCKYHRYFREGIRNPHACGDGSDEYIVPPIKSSSFNKSSWERLPEHGVPDGLETHWYNRDEDDVDEDVALPAGSADPGADPSPDDPSGGDDADHTPSKPWQAGVNSLLLERWLHDSDGNTAQQVRSQLAEHGLDARRGADELEAIMRLFHGVTVSECRLDVISLPSLARRLCDQPFNVPAGGDVGLIVMELRREMDAIVAATDVQYVASGCPHIPERPTGGDPMQDQADDLAAALNERDLGKGTTAEPFMYPARSGVPLSEYKARVGYMTLAWPALFPLGLGDFNETREHKLTWNEWATHLQKFYDGRFAQHPRFPYFLLNSRERMTALQLAGVYVRASAPGGEMTMGQLRALSRKEKQDIFRECSTFGATLRNTPSFFNERRKELFAMNEQLGHAHAFATNSHADTHCPYLHEYIAAWAQKAMPMPPNANPAKIGKAAWVPHRDDPTWDGLKDNERYARRTANLIRFPHVVAQFFHLKTELFIKHICEGALGAEAHWGRYEWQSRGSTHIHFFLWLRDAPDLSFLDEMVQKRIRERLPPDGGSLTEEQADAIVAELNRFALDAVVNPPDDGALSKPNCGSAGACDCGNKCFTIPETLSDAADGALLSETARCARASQWWARLATRYNSSWNEMEGIPCRGSEDAHPASRKHMSVSQAVAAMECEVCDDDEQPQAGGAACSRPARCEFTTNGLPAALVDFHAARANRTNRHIPCRASYCLRVDKHGKRFCRFHFPQQPRETNDVPHFYCERVKGGIRWRLHLPLNDPFMNSVNPEQSASQAANVDFRPLIDHFTAIEYSTKYATKQEKGSKAFDKLVADAIRRTKDLPDDAPARSAFSSYLIQQVGGRDWSAQEVAHVNNSIPTVICSHAFFDVSLAEHARIRKDVKASAGDDAVATETGSWVKYLRRANSLFHYRLKDPTQTTMEQHVDEASRTASAEERRIMNCSLTEFYRLYEFKSNGRGHKGSNQIVRRETPTIVRVKPRLPPSCADAKGTAVRKTYCRVKLQSHKCFESQRAYERYVFEDHGGDIEAAYEHFATTDPDAPACVKDDFRELHFEDEGTEVVDEHAERATADADFALVDPSPRFQEALDKVSSMQSSTKEFWAQRTAETYLPEQIKAAGTWQKSASHAEAQARPSDDNAIQLNEGQRFPFCLVVDHDRRQRLGAKVEPLHALVSGTAGSGKTVLIRALKHQLGDRCVVMAPTGVAADNIGGSTYHRLLPVPSRGNLNRQDIRVKGDRYKTLVSDWHGRTHVIIDEMSMIGRRNLGYIDELLKQARKNNQPFGGLNIILVGDHGQLPPVKDSCMYDWSGVRYVCNSNGVKSGDYLASAPIWERRGVEMYDLIITKGWVFFLDGVERTRNEDFRRFQLRARDGELGPATHETNAGWVHDDWKYVATHMDAAKRPGDFSGPEVYHLVSSHAERDHKNATELESAVERGAPAMRIDAINSSRTAAEADEHEMKLPNHLLLCIGARVMVIQNLCVAHGLVNGTTGFVHDIMCDAQGEPVAILVKVRRRTATQDGYSGPSFLDDASGVDLATHAIVAITMHECRMYDGGMCHTRLQFPIMLSWAVTVYKAQGLTLERVQFDAGDDEQRSGFFFTALTRVREPSHIGFSPVPDRERITSLIACKPALYKRKVHEHFLRRQAQRTARLFEGGLTDPETGTTIYPPAAALQPLRQAPKRYVKPPAPTVYSKKRPATTRLASVLKSSAKRQHSGADAGACEVQLPALGRGVPNRTAGLPSATAPSALDAPPPHPGWLTDVLARFSLRARIIDYDAAGAQAREHVKRHLEHIGFAVEVDTSHQQSGPSCGYVAARAAHILHAAADGTFIHASTGDAVEQAWVDEGNALLLAHYHETYEAALVDVASPVVHVRTEAERRLSKAAARIHELKLETGQQPLWLTCSEIQLITAQWQRAVEGADAEPYLNGTHSRDGSLADIASDLQALAETGAFPGASAASALRIRIVNTDFTGGTGTHWFTVAYGASPRSNGLVHLPHEGVGAEDEQSLDEVEAMEDMMVMEGHAGGEWAAHWMDDEMMADEMFGELY